MKGKFKIICLTILALFCILLVSCGKTDIPITDDNIVKPTFKEAYLLTIDGEKISYLEDENVTYEIQTALKNQKEQELKESGTSFEEIKLDSVFEISKVEVLEDSISTVEKILEIIGDLLAVKFKITVTEYSHETISFKTVYENSSLYYEGTSKVKTEGVDGSKKITYKVTYSENTEIERAIIEENIEKSAVNKVVLIGTKKSTASTGSYCWPIDGTIYITSYFGPRIINGVYDYHYGIDLRAAVGSKILASDGGKVIYAGYMGSYGYLVKIEHDNGNITYYGHLSKIYVKLGERVYKGQVIALSGATGNVTGPHLHFEIRKNGKLTDPLLSLPKF